MDIPFDIFGTPACTPRHVQKHWPEFYNYLQELFPGLIFAEQVYLFAHDLKEPHKCPKCGKYTKFINYNKGYHEYCSLKCASIDNYEKTKQTCLKKYGVENAMMSEEFKQKSKDTCLKRYGVEYSFAADEVREKIKQTNIEKYGGVGFASEILNKKGKQTCLKKYGDENFNNREKAEQTCLKKYGTENPFQVEEFKEKSRFTMKEKYGGEYTQQSEILKEKCKQTLLKHYGVDHQSKAKEVIDKITKNNRDRFLKQSEFLVGYTNDSDWICKCPHPECDKCQEKSYIIQPINYYARREFNIEPCTKLRPIQPVTNNDTTLEHFVRNILDEYNIQYETNNRKILNGRELDIFIPDKNIAIECNGTFFHSNKIKDNRYHIQKFIDCQKLNIQLLTVWEDQIFNTPEIVKSIILAKLGIFETTIGARKCKIKEIDSHTCTQFLNVNHIQGETKTKIRIGMYFNDDLVSVMTFSKKSKLSGSNKYDDTEWELTRFCNKLNTSIIGGFAKMLKYFINKYKPNTISSFASNDISDGEIYKINGFIQEGHITSAYWYVKKNNLIRYHRSSFTKNKLKQMGYDIENKTESEIMRDLPYYKIYDSGHTKYILNI